MTLIEILVHLIRVHYGRIRSVKLSKTGTIGDAHVRLVGRLGTKETL